MLKEWQETGIVLGLGSNDTSNKFVCLLFLLIASRFLLRLLLANDSAKKRTNKQLP